MSAPPPSRPRAGGLSAVCCALGSVAVAPVQASGGRRYIQSRAWCSPDGVRVQPLRRPYPLVRQTDRHVALCPPLAFSTCPMTSRRGSLRRRCITSATTSDADLSSCSPPPAATSPPLDSFPPPVVPNALGLRSAYLAAFGKMLSGIPRAHYHHIRSGGAETAPNVDQPVQPERDQLCPAPSTPVVSTARGLRWACLVALGLHLASNVAAVLGTLGPNVIAMSTRNTTFLTLAQWTFIIWGVIFFLQGLGLLSWLRSGEKSVDAAARRVAPLWVAGWLCQTVWLILFAQGALGTAQFALVGATAALQAALFRLRVVAPSSQASRSIRWGWVVPTSINAAWLTVATSIGALQLVSSPGQAVTPTGVLCVIGVVLMVLHSLVEMPSLQTHDNIAGGEHRPRLNIPYSMTLMWGLQGVHVAAAKPLLLVGKGTLQALLSVVVGLTILHKLLMLLISIVISVRRCDEGLPQVVVKNILLMLK